MSNKKFVDFIGDFIRQHNLMNVDGCYLVALSGGADSVALLTVLLELGYKIEAVHCNFHLRGEESNRDEQFCKTLCTQKNVPLHLAHFDTKEYARLHKISIEMAARDLRYHYFNQLCRDMKAQGVCVAHHADDQVETVLLNLIRGTGIDGLVGMQPKNSSIIRPLLCVNRLQILNYLSSEGQNYVTDSTNLVDDVQRNVLRLDIIPQLEKVNPAFKRNILRMTDNMQEVRTAVNTHLKSVAKQARACFDEVDSKIIYQLHPLLAYPSPLVLFHYILSPYGFNRSQLKEMVMHAVAFQHASVETGLWKNDKYVAIISKTQLEVVARQVFDMPFEPLLMPEPGLYRRDDLACRIKEFDGELKVVRSASMITINADKVVFPMVLRRVKAGDKFIPYGMKGHKLVGDYLKDAHVDFVARKHQLILTDGKDQIIWLVGHRIDDRYKIEKEGTPRVLTVEIINSNHQDS